jgi:predicted MPP superfamily phosphohydrolase
MIEAILPFSWVVILYNCVLFALGGAAALRVWRRRWSNAAAIRVLASGCLLLGLVGLAGAAVGPVERGFGTIQLLAWMVCLHWPLYLVSTAPAFLPRQPRVFGVCLAVGGLIAAVSIEAFLVEPHRLDVSHLSISTSKLDRPVRIGLLADIQTDAPGPFERQVLQRVKDEHCDLILLAGDYIQAATEARYGPAVQALGGLFRGAGLNPSLGTYAVAGNVDLPDWQSIFTGLPVTCVDDRREFDLGPVVLTTLSSEQSFDPKCSVAGTDKFHIVLGHSPDFSLGQVQADLLLAGHTHGGQVVLPLIGPLLTFCQIPRSWASGRTALGGLSGSSEPRTLVVSRGIGMERKKAPRVRFLCRPELVIIDLVPAAAAPPLRIAD